jgi:hypothetical protein
MKSKVFLLFMFLLSLGAYGQVAHYIGIQGGLNQSNVSTDPSENTLNLKGITSGLNYRILFPKGYAVGIDILYIQNGYENEIDYTDQYGNIILVLGIKDRYNYLSLPIKFSYEIGGRIKVFSNVGIQTSILLSAKSMISNVNGQVYIEEFNITDNVAPIDFGGIIELGTGINLGDSFSLMAIAGYSHSLTSFSNTKFYGNMDFRHYAICFSLGIKYKLNKT